MPTEAELLEACAASGQMDSRQVAAHVEAGEMLRKVWPADQGAEPVPLPKLPPAIVMHPQLGELFDRLAMHLYAMGYAQECFRAATAATPLPTYHQQEKP